MVTLGSPMPSKKHHTHTTKLRFIQIIQFFAMRLTTRVVQLRLHPQSYDWAVAVMGPLGSMRPPSTPLGPRRSPGRWRGPDGHPSAWRTLMADWKINGSRTKKLSVDSELDMQ